jgi:hypothetical protein
MQPWYQSMLIIVCFGIDLPLYSSPAGDSETNRPQKMLSNEGPWSEGATITVTNVGKGNSQTAVSGSDGDCVVPFLAAGAYRVASLKLTF